MYALYSKGYKLMLIEVEDEDYSRKEYKGMDFAYKILYWFFWGLFMSIGWVVGTNVIGLIGSLMHK